MKELKCVPLFLISLLKYNFLFLLGQLALLYVSLGLHLITTLILVALITYVLHLRTGVKKIATQVAISKFTQIQNVSAQNNPVTMVSK